MVSESLFKIKYKKVRNTNFIVQIIFIFFNDCNSKIFEQFNLLQIIFLKIDAKSYCK